MYYTKLIKCGSCKEKFKIKYDSKKKSQDEYICPCGRTIVSPRKNSILIYRGSLKPLSFEEQEYTIFHHDDDYIKLSDEANLLLEEISVLSEKIKKIYKGNISFTNQSNDEKLLLQLFTESSFEEISIIVDIILCKNYEWSDDEQKNTEERIIQALTRFKNVLVKIKNKEINLKYPSSFYIENELQWFLCKKNRIPGKGYDYFMYC